MAYIGRPLNAGNLAVQSGTGDGSDTTPIATLDYSVGSSNSVAVYLDGVRQLAGTDFTASGTTLTFTTAPANGVGIDVYFLGLELSIPTPGDDTVTGAKIVDNAIDSEHYTDGSIDTAHIAANQIDETLMKDALIADFTEVTVTASDSILLGDATDSGNTKRDTVQGILDLASHTGNVAFPASQVASADANTLDDYEEGTFTPVLGGGSTAGVTANGTGYYTKIGRLVSCDIRFNNVAISGGSGDAKISSFPFTMSTGGVSGAYGVSLPLTYKITHGGVRNGFYTGGGGTAMYGLESHSASGWASWAITDFFGSGNIYINMSIVYISA